ncbi:MAG: helix-turn-helix transcriptional regulator [Lachnospiraceae bacterium]|nr:helix-turn-helix transcriptional regulator [Lachnospiraceae bacterium]
MEFNIGSKIKKLRRQKNISQEVLAQYLGISFQAVSKWESGQNMPDITLIPALASFFGISTDELFDYNYYETEKRVAEIVDVSYPYRGIDDAKCEAILREGLKKYPGNDVLLNCLIYSIPVPERSDEVISICRSLIEGTREDDIKYDACRVLAETYHKIGEPGLVKETLQRIPEIYFTRLELEAELLEGDDKFRAADGQKGLSADSLFNMLECLAGCYEEKGEPEKAKIQLDIALKIFEAFKDDFLSEGMCRTVCQCHEEQAERIRQRIRVL